MASLSVIGAPSSAGAYAPGQEKAPAAFRRNGLFESLSEGRSVIDRGDIPGFRWQLDTGRPDAMNLEAVRGAAMALADRVSVALAAGDKVLVLGGDCTIELGTVAGAIRDGGSVGLIYIDLDVDLNVPATSDGALDWTGVAHLLDLPGSLSELSGIAAHRPMLNAGGILYFAADNITPAEARVMQKLDLSRIALPEVSADSRTAAARAVEWGRSFDRLLVHLDVDVLAFTDFPIAENVRRRAGLTLDQLCAALEVLLAAPNWAALTLAEINPDHAPDEAESFTRLNAMLANALPY